jgi:hypothetical protein
MKKKSKKVTLVMFHNFGRSFEKYLYFCDSSSGTGDVVRRWYEWCHKPHSYNTMVVLVTGFQGTIQRLILHKYTNCDIKQFLEELYKSIYRIISLYCTLTIV